MLIIYYTKLTIVRQAKFCFFDTDLRGRTRFDVNHVNANSWCLTFSQFANSLIHQSTNRLLLLHSLFDIGYSTDRMLAFSHFSTFSATDLAGLSGVAHLGWRRILNTRILYSVSWILASVSLFFVLFSHFFWPMCSDSSFFYLFMQDSRFFASTFHYRWTLY